MNQNKNFIKASIWAGIVFGVIMGAVNCIISASLVHGIGSGLISGFLFGIFILIFGLIQNSRFKKQGLKEINGEQVIVDGPANHFKGRESVGGYLYLTKKTIFFKSHKINIQVHEINIPINEILRVETSSSLGLIPNGVKIVTKNGVEKFVVFNRNMWLENINNTMLLSQFKEDEIELNL